MPEEIPPNIKIAIDTASDQAVLKVFSLLGVDINRPESVEAFREDLRFGRALRRARDHGLFAVVALVASAIGYAAWRGILAFVRGDL